ncbi:hypothetical protein BH10CHL1_BH10CHL1_28240 [soil metagenome]
MIISVMSRGIVNYLRRMTLPIHLNLGRGDNHLFVLA